MSVMEDKRETCGRECCGDYAEKLAVSCRPVEDGATRITVRWDHDGVKYGDSVTYDAQMLQAYDAQMVQGVNELMIQAAVGMQVLKDRSPMAATLATAYFKLTETDLVLHWTDPSGDRMQLHSPIKAYARIETQINHLLIDMERVLDDTEETA